MGGGEKLIKVEKEREVYDDTYDEISGKLISTQNDCPIICSFLFSYFSNTPSSNHCLISS